MSHWKHNIEGVNWASYKLYEREHLFASVVRDNGITLDQPPFVILWEDPDQPDAPAAITVPAPAWWAMALHGGILPPVEVYWALQHDESKPGFSRHHRGYLLHETTPMRAMTEQEAMEYLVMKDVPPRVWRDYKGNRTILKIVPRSLIPADRAYRNAWRIDQTPTKEQEAA